MYNRYIRNDNGAYSRVAQQDSPKHHAAPPPPPPPPPLPIPSLYPQAYPITKSSSTIMHHLRPCSVGIGERNDLPVRTL